MQFIERQYFQNSYITYGKGKNAYFTFHGFGQSPLVFEKLTHAFPNSKIYSFYLLGHQPESLPKTCTPKENWLAHFCSFVDSLELEKINLVAHSLGARHVWAILEAMPEKVGNVFLIAPNGLENFNLFDFCTRTIFGKFCFKFFLRNYDTISPSLHFFQQISPFKKLLLFAQSQTNTEEKRQILNNTWNAYSEYKPDWSKIEHHLNQFQINTKLILAKNDQIINNKNLVERFGNVDSAQIEYIDISHYYVLKEWIENISTKK